jgi:peroxiredoxin
MIFAVNKLRLLFVINVIQSLTIIFLIFKLMNFSSFDYESIKRGDKVPRFLFKNLYNQSDSIHYSKGLDYLFFVMSTSCPHCVNNLNLWNEIYNIESNIIKCGLVIDDLNEIKSFLNNYDVKFPLISVTDSSFINGYKVIGVPMTILVKSHDGYGEVKELWFGELSDQNINNIKLIITKGVNYEEAN